MVICFYWWQGSKIVYVTMFSFMTFYFMHMYTTMKITNYWILFIWIYQTPFYGQIIHVCKFVKEGIICTKMKVFFLGFFRLQSSIWSFQMLLKWGGLLSPLSPLLNTIGLCFVMCDYIIMCGLWLSFDLCGKWAH
jgi:hypothetical protein